METSGGFYILLEAFLSFSIQLSYIGLLLSEWMEYLLGVNSSRLAHGMKDIGGLARHNSPTKVVSSSHCREFASMQGPP
jgi:hypothetical protein